MRQLKKNKKPCQEPALVECADFLDAIAVKETSFAGEGWDIASEMGLKEFPTFLIWAARFLRELRKRSEVFGKVVVGVDITQDTKFKCQSLMFRLDPGVDHAKVIVELVV
ncbi:hypothetical protein M427DRAFT_410417 [Gonapodya prolifera JEL478]|uniref:Uncharacterized protein n=1 Tax=Gonapodya prolifera (strain JEL478) TaxID=1344416 RepID=A0A139A5S4_GONPJ|nr:hypothetical protein M427DRAFT_410417 [Gonapodya prolifera JEL478]|eukprot:KXS12091.1 hypothetical protein M427DRAFT_410417 [Gonapodya prolifera JEL478]